MSFVGICKLIKILNCEDSVIFSKSDFLKVSVMGCDREIAE